MGPLKFYFQLYQTVDCHLANPPCLPSMAIHVVVDPIDPLFLEDIHRRSLSWRSHAMIFR
jgi:hypothetical protein